MPFKQLIKAILFVAIPVIMILLIPLYYVSHKPKYVWDATKDGYCTFVVFLITLNPNLINSRLSNDKTDALSFYRGLYREGTPGMTLLHYAAFEGKTEIVKFLLSKGMDVNVRDQRNATPLYYAVLRNHQKTANLLISSKADVNAKIWNGEPLLHTALWSGEKDIIELLVLNGVNLNSKDKKGNTSLSLAIKYGQKDIADLLRKHGAKE